MVINHILKSTKKIIETRALLIEFCNKWDDPSIFYKALMILMSWSNPTFHDAIIERIIWFLSTGIVGQGYTPGFPNNPSQWCSFLHLLWCCFNTLASHPVTIHSLIATHCSPKWLGKSKTNAAVSGDLLYSHIQRWKHQPHLWREIIASKSLQMWRTHMYPYCWWKKSCTTWDVWNPVNNGKNYLSTAAGFLPSTVSYPLSILFVAF